MKRGEGIWNRSNYSICSQLHNVDNDEKLGLASPWIQISLGSDGRYEWEPTAITAITNEKGAPTFILISGFQIFGTCCGKEGPPWGNHLAI